MLYYLPLPRDLRLLLAGESCHTNNVTSSQPCMCGTHTPLYAHTIGLAAGLSLLFYRSSSIALYVAWKALEVSCVAPT